MNIGIDCDGVLADHVSLSCTIWNSRPENRTHPLYPMTSATWDQWYINEKIGCSTSELHKLFDDAWALYVCLPLMESDLKTTLRRLHRNGHTITIITNRNMGTAKYVVAWLELHDLYHDVLIINDRGPAKLSYPIDVLIDDNPNLIEQPVPAGKHLFIRLQPWNRNDERLANVPGAVDMHLITYLSELGNRLRGL